MSTIDAEFIPLSLAALRLGVPAAWLKAEAKAGRVPALFVGRRILFKPNLVSVALSRRASEAVVVEREELAHA
jgi:hypothetical protein